MTIDEHFFFKKAPAAIVILSKDKVSASLAASNMALMAEAENLQRRFFFTMAVNVSRALRYAFGIKGKYRAVTTLVLGYPDVKYYRTVQKEKPVVRRM